MNSYWKVSKYSINEESIIVDEITTYFDVWIEQRSVVKFKENMKETQVEKYFISQITYNNMKTLV